MSEEDKVKSFMEVTNLGREEAEAYLAMYNGNLESAIHTALENAAQGVKIDPGHAVMGQHLMDEFGYLEHDDLLDEQIVGQRELPQARRQQQLEEDLIPPTRIINESGTEFWHMLRLTLQSSELRINWIKNTLKQTIRDLDFPSNPLLVYVHKLDHPNAQKIVTKILQNAEFAKMINGNFQPIGLLATSKEIRTVLKFTTMSQLPGFVVLSKKSAKEVSFENMVSLTGNVECEQAFDELTKYLDKRISLGESFRYTPFGQADRDRMRRIELERQIKAEQEKKYQDMLEEEQRKAQQADEERRRVEVQRRQEAEEQEAFERFKASCRRDLPPEPTEGRLVSIAFRLPNGSKVARNFQASDPVKSMRAFVYSREELEFSRPVQLMHDYPLRPVGPEVDEESLANFFKGSDRELITVLEASKP